MEQSNSNYKLQEKPLKLEIQREKSSSQYLGNQAKRIQGQARDLFKILSDNHLQDIWKEELNFYYQAWMKKRSNRNIKLWKHITSILLNLLNDIFQNNIESYAEKQIKLNRQNYCHPSIKINKLINPKQPICVVLSHRIQKTQKPELIFELNAINIEGKIVFTFMNIRKWQKVQAQFVKIQKQFRDYFLIVQQQDQLMLLYNAKIKNSEMFLNKLQYSEVVKIKQNYVNLYGQNKIEGDNQSKLSSLVNAYNVYAFIKKSLVKNIKTMQKKTQPSQVYWSIFYMAYNMVLPLIQNTEQQYKKQIQNHLNKLLYVIDQFNKTKQMQQQRNKTQHHLPGNLTNAHVCRRCKKRSYISCPTCSEFQCREISLCLHCYGPYHDATLPTFQINSPQVIFDKWESNDRSIEYCLSSEQPHQITPFSLLIKKQEEQAE